MAPLEHDGAMAFIEIADRAPHCTTLSLKGEIDISNVDAMRHTMREVAASAPTRIVVDCIDLHYLDSSGIAMLLAATEHCDVEVRHASPVIARLLRATGVAELLHLGA